MQASFILDFGGVEARGDAEAGVVDENVDGSFSVRQSVGDGSLTLFCEEVGFEDLAVRGEVHCECFEPLRVACHEYEVDSELGELTAELCSETRGRSGYQRCIRHRSSMVDAREW